MGGNAWRIKVETANAILRDAEGEAESFAEVATNIETALEEITALAGPKTASAATELFSELFMIEIATMHGTVNASASATMNAIAAYDDGDTQMASTAQKSIEEMQDALP